MSQNKEILKDSFGRKHSYLRISLTERCNLRCSYCMPLEGVTLLPKSHLMNAEEVFQIAKIFVNEGVDKIRLTGGEPLVRKDFPEILRKLSSLPAKLTMTTNGVTVDRHFDLLKECGMQTINLSLDTLQKERFKEITFRDQFDKVHENMFKLLELGFKVKINVVLMKGVNDDEIIDFIEFTKNYPFVVRFIEFMPFEGNKWKRDQTVSLNEILERLNSFYPKNDILRIPDAPNDTAKNYKIKGYSGEFGIISTVTNPFCDSCNRIRLTANGQLKNCLFSQSESDLLTPFRNGEEILPIIQKAVGKKFAMRGGLSKPDDFNNPEMHHNRSMIRIGG
ncbi:GTP 3',8-cyclase MoaA [Algoriphagus sp. C2-7]|uniref:GTP 3',8-cyclase n=1 Tax=Algoriphagus sediminis TaxID=3057113 RepID=A0ABT7YGB8_9BACT|nr:GTP 3',8-cyclase MoaA [Algoriphagus sediminis]MDN3205244.1 GTP 3',8-cyclase MoaA [Algoriphagus sediminis]